MYEIENDFWWYAGMRRTVSAILDPLRESDERIGTDLFNILDAGSGTGANLAFLWRYGNPIGIDLSPEALQFSTKRPHLTETLGSVSNLPFADASFDLVTSFEVLY